MHGLFTNTADVDCSVCKTDLWLSAVVSRAAPGEAVCPAHAATLLGCPEEKALLFRYTFEELEAMVATAVELIEGTAEAVEFAKQRRHLWKVRAVHEIHDLKRQMALPMLPPDSRLGGQEYGIPRRLVQPPEHVCSG